MPNFPASKPPLTYADHGALRDEVREIADGVGYTSISKTAAYTAVAGEYIKADATTAAFTITLPASGRVTVQKVDASVNAVTVVGAGVTTINGDASATIVEQWAGATFHFDGTNWIIRSVM